MLPESLAIEGNKDIRLVDQFSDFEHFFIETRHAEREVFQVPKRNLNIFSNGITELPGKMGQLGELRLNIPVLAQIEGATAMPIEQARLNRVLLANLYQVSYFFRSHVLLQKWVFQRYGNLQLSQLLGEILHPLILLNNHINPDNPIETGFQPGPSTLDSVSSFEQKLNKLYAINAPNAIETPYVTDEMGQSIEQPLPWLLENGNGQYRQLLSDIMACLDSVRSSIKNFFVYGSLAKNTMRPGSDVDAVLVLSDGVLGDQSQLSAALSAIFDANALVRDSHFIANGEPFHYLFEREIASIPAPPLFRDEILKHSKSLIGPAINPYANRNNEYDEWCKRFGLINNFQKIRHEAVGIINNGDIAELQRFSRQCIRHVVNRLGTYALAALQRPISGNEAQHALSQTFPDLKREFAEILHAQQFGTDFHSARQIAFLMDFYKEITLRCYDLK